MNKINKNHNRAVYLKSNFFRRSVCCLFISINILIISVIVLLKHHAIDFYAMVDVLQHLFPSVIIIGGLGWFAGLILDNPKKRMIIDYKDLIYEELLKNQVKISPEELDRKLRLNNPEDIEDEENFPFEDAEMNIGESEIDL